MASDEMHIWSLTIKLQYGASLSISPPCYTHGANALGVDNRFNDSSLSFKKNIFVLYKR